MNKRKKHAFRITLSSLEFLEKTSKYSKIAIDKPKILASFLDNHKIDQEKIISDIKETMETYNEKKIKDKDCYNKWYINSNHRFAKIRDPKINEKFNNCIN